MKGIKFITNPGSYNPDGAFVIHLSRLNSKDELFEQLNLKLALPDYFGYNWDALSDCLRDLSWIEQRQVVLVHDDVPQFNKQILESYLTILFDAIQDWEIGDGHYLEIVFPEQAKTLVEELKP